MANKFDKNTHFINFINKANIIHSNYYDYSKSIYINNKIDIEIICPIHGSFFQRPDNHTKNINPAKCPFCSEITRRQNKTRTHEKFIELSNKVHNNKYIYPDKYINQDTKINIECPIHGIFKQKPERHLFGDGCPKCANKNITHEEFVERSNKIHKYKYKYIDKYKSTHEKVIIECPKHGLFIQTPHNHISGKCGCPYCNESKGEKLIKEILNNKNIKYIPQHTFYECKNVRKLPFDFYLPELNTCIEFDGIQHFKPIEYFGGIESFEYQKINDNIKNEYCKNKNIKLIRISYKDKNKIKDIIINNINQVLPNLNEFLELVSKFKDAYDDKCFIETFDIKTFELSINKYEDLQKFIDKVEELKIEYNHLWT